MGVASQGARVAGTLHLCDLAGSERISRSGAEGQRLKEALNINKSLSCLTDVFNALGNKQAFIPFRNSKLTYFLQPALSGDGACSTLLVCDHGHVCDCALLDPHPIRVYVLRPTWVVWRAGKTMMFVNVSPTEASYFETLCSLRFAA